MCKLDACLLIFHLNIQCFLQYKFQLFLFQHFQMCFNLIDKYNPGKNNVDSSPQTISIPYIDSAPTQCCISRIILANIFSLFINIEKGNWAGRQILDTEYTGNVLLVTKLARAAQNNFCRDCSFCCCICTIYYYTRYNLKAETHRTRFDNTA